MTLSSVMCLIAASAAAQPPVSDPPQMCGDGTTFTVQLPGTTLGIDDKDGLFKSIDVPDVARADSVTLPNGCRIYAVFISGYSNNGPYGDIPFFKVAEFVAKHNGYVHIGWWNNFTKEYTGGPLHPETITIQPMILGIPHGDPETYGPTPAISDDLLAFAPATSLVDRPKANPDDDFQFQSDAALVLKAIRSHNPDALIVVAGHSMGGNAVARLGMNSTVPIDLLAPIDPVGNRDKPRGIPGENNFNWTRWRVAHQFRGWKQWDCVRTGGVLNACKDFDPRVFFFSYECVPTGDWLEEKPVIATRAPVGCPYLTPYVDPGARLGFGPNVKNLYHRWQQEFLWPVDFPTTERFNFHKPRSTVTLWPNYQEPVLQQLNPFLPNDPDKTCVAGTDPRDSSWQCNPTDGHGEIIGHRGLKGESRPALEMLGNWPRGNQYAQRRRKIVELATADDTWIHRPENPNLCLVCDDMISIIQHLMANQPQPPTGDDEEAPVSNATPDPGPGPAGWNNEDVEVTVAAVDEVGGSGVKEIEISLSGAQTGSTTTAGDHATVTITAEGETTVTFLARDVAGNAETPQMLKVLIDKTSPTITATTGVEPNSNGWFRTPVVVHFAALDTGSGLADSSGDVPVASEGADQEIVGTATDLAGNTATASVTLNIDLTPPGIAIATPPDDATYLVNAKVPAAFSCSDNLSGVNTCTGDVANGAPLDTSTPGAALFSVHASDVAENLASATRRYLVRYAFSGFGAPVTGLPQVNSRKAGAVVPVKYSLADANGKVVSATTFVSLTSAPVQCGVGSPLGPGEPAGAAGQTSIRADSSGQFIFNWKTDRSWEGSCRALRLTLSDGSEHVALFQFD
jgi:hypothetical protein